MAREQRRFGDIGVESAAVGQRMVMWISPGQVFILSNSIDDDDPTAAVGTVTYPVIGTSWGNPGDLEIAEFLRLHVNSPNFTKKLSK